MSLLIPTVPVVLIRAALAILLRRRRLLPFINEISLSLLIVIGVLKALIVDSELKVLPMLHDVEHVVADLERMLERSAEPLSLED
jgi:hypothetical protein